jgi:homogentisate 1,2-dioxygenase
VTERPPQPLLPPHVEGRVSRQAHADLPEGTYEREIGRDGFFGPATHMYHRHPPTAWSAIEGPLRPRAFDTQRLSRSDPCPLAAPVLAHNPHLRVQLWRTDASMDHLVRNADGDQLLFVHRGRGALFCDYGHMELRSGDYVVLPRGTLWRVEIKEPLCALSLEITDARLSLPDRGPLGAHAVYDPGVLETPVLDAAFVAQQTERPWRVVVRARGELSTVTYPFSPLDAVGWKGTLAPVRLSVGDIRPVLSARYHVPPSAHTTFVAPRLVVCTFCPRPLESDPGALKLPFFHNNDDFDELIFYHSGSFMSRDDIGPGMMTLHPRGLTHGPHPKALEAAARGARKETDEIAVMIDTRDRLEVTPEAAATERTSYALSWSTRDGAGDALPRG